ncbi:MAG: SBBP repeat-containing protein [Acidobacteriia bacterium]|nr:SBBP repeat-containing protein [Terriglobia bacterium]
MRTAGNHVAGDRAGRGRGSGRLARLRVSAAVSLAGLCLTAAPDSGPQLRSTPQPARSTDGSIARRAPDFGRLPLSFEVNRGQTDGRVRFLSRGQGYTLFLTSEEAVLSLRSASQKSKVKGQKAKGSERRLPVPPGTLETTTDSGQLTKDNPSVLRMRLAGANRNARVVGLDELPGRSNYFLGNDAAQWRTNVPSYGRVRYEQVYPGIDLVYHGKEPEARSQESQTNPNRPATRDAELEFDFVVAPGADPRAIRFAVETENGSSKIEIRNSKLGSPDPSPESRVASPELLRIDATGDLVISTEAGDVRLRKPVVYQQHSAVGIQHSAAAGNRQSAIDNRHFLDGRYVLRTSSLETRKSKIENRNSKLGPRDPDPEFRTPSPEFEVSFQLASFDPTRPLVIDPVLSYSTYLGGSGLDYGAGIAVDRARSAYVTGYTNSRDFPLGQPVQGAPGGGRCGSGLDTYACSDAFVVKLDATGTRLVYATYFGGSGEDYGAAIAVDAAGGAYITGYTNSTNLATVRAFQPGHGGGVCGTPPNTFPCFDAFVAKLDREGSSLVYSTYLGGSADDYGQGIAVDTGGNAIVSGFTASSDFPLARAVQDQFGGGSYDAFVTKLRAAGTALVYSTYLGGSGDDFGARTAVDTGGNAYATGSTNSPDFPTSHALQPAYAGGTCGALSSTFPCFDAYVAKLNPQGAFAYSTYLGGSGGDYGYGIAVDSSGSAYLTGQTTSVDFPVTWHAFQTSGGGTSTDAFVTKLRPDGAAAAYSTYLGGEGAEAGLDIAVDSAHSAYVTGYTYGSGFPLVEPVQKMSGGFFDAFLAKVDAAAGMGLEFSTYLGGSGNEKAHGVAVDNRGSAYLVGETFSTDFPVTPSALERAYGGGSYDAFVAKLTTQQLRVLSLSTAKLGFAGQRTGTTSAHDTVSLRGDGEAPASLFFDGRVVGTSSDPEELTLTNAGRAPRALSGITTTGDFTQTSDCDESLPAGGSCTTLVTFTPAAPGPRSGSLTVTDAHPPEAQSASLLGMGRDFSVSASPGAAEIAAGESATFTLTLEPAGGFDKTVTLGCSGAPPAAACVVSPSRVTLDGTGSARARVKLQTTARGEATPEADVSSPGLFAPRSLPSALLAILALSLALLRMAVIRGRLRWARAGLAVAMFAVLFWSTCAEGGGAPVPPFPLPEGTPAGTYTFTLTGTCGSLAHSTAVTLTVK